MGSGRVGNTDWLSRLCFLHLGNSGCSVYAMTGITGKDSAGVTISTC